MEDTATDTMIDNKVDTEPTMHMVTDKRLCDEAGCNTVLSMYNKYEYCALHQPMIIPRMRGTVLK